MDVAQLIQQWQSEAEQPFIGWDFTPLQGRYHQETPPWSYTDRVRALLPGKQRVLDMGTGDGKKLLEFRGELPKYTVATEGYAPNLPIAQANLQPHGISVVRYDSEHDARMPFADKQFDLILNRHESFDASEVARVLRPGGIFCTQQVDGRNLDDLRAVFGGELSYPNIRLKHFEAQLKLAGLIVTQSENWQGKATFSDVGALVYYLKAVPWEAPPDFSVSRYQEQLLQLHRSQQLTFNIRRFFVEARKPA
jgi:SAM-dependent methyltransferase